MRQQPKLGQALARLSLDPGTAQAVHRVALRCMEARTSTSLLAWRVDDAFIAPLRQFSGLEVLELGSCYLLTDGPLACCLRAMPRLRVLDVDRCKRLTDWGLAPIAEGATPQLRELHVGGTAVGAPVLTALGACTPSLAVLRHCGRYVTDAILLALCAEVAQVKSSQAQVKLGRR